MFVLNITQANILLDDRLHICITDFGLARFTDTGNSTNGINSGWMGATKWMPPEVLQGQACGYAGDVYSFACVCLEVSDHLHARSFYSQETLPIDRFGSTSISRNERVPSFLPCTRGSRLPHSYPIPIRVIIDDCACFKNP